MSIRAYKIIEIKTEKDPSFNVSQKYDILDTFRHYATYNSNDELSSIEYCREDIDEVLQETEEVLRETESGVGGYNREEVEELANIILKDMGEEDYVNYYCY
jgi:hypothetical protein